MTSDAPTKAGKHVTSNDACAHCQRYTGDSVFLIGQNDVCYDVEEGYIYAFCCEQTSFQMVGQMGCRYVNEKSKWLLSPFTRVVRLSLFGTRVGSWYWLRLGRPTLQGKFITVTVRRDVILSFLERRRIKSEKTRHCIDPLMT